jgi:Na+/H+-dicarboxylate symporter
MENVVQKKSKNTSKMIVKILIAFVVGSLLGRLLILSDISILLLRGMITFSDLISQFLSFFVPIVVLGLVMPGIIELGGKASKMLLTAIILSYASLLTIGFISFIFGYSFVPSIFSSMVIGGNVMEMTNYSGFLPKLLSPFFDVVGAIVLAFAFGLAAAKTGSEIFTKAAKEIEACIYLILNKFLIPILPLYIGCIFAKLSATGELMANLNNFAMIIFVIFLISNIYTLLIISLGAILTKRSIIAVLKAYVSTYLVAFGTQSSKATIPVSLDSAEKINISKEVREFAVPLLATTHLIGSMVTQTIGSIAIYYIFTGEMLSLPLMASYIFVLATILLAAPGIPGGEPVATKPLLVSYLGFPAGAAETMFMLGVANDSFATAINVTGDSPIVMILDSLYKKWFKK